MNKENIKKDIEELREEKNCAQSTLIGTCKNTDKDFDLNELSTLTVAFGGGIGGTFDEGTCGALTGAVMALGFIESDPEKLKTYSKELFEKFQDKYESVTCGKISKNGEDKTLCTECCVYAGEVVSDLLK